MLLMLPAELREAEPSMIELPRWLASHSSVNFPGGQMGVGAARVV